MKLLQKITSCIALALACSATQAAAITYDYSYKFRDNQMIVGTFTGVEAGGLISGIGNVTGHITGGLANDGYVFQDLLPGSYQAGSIVHSGAVVALNKIDSNFFFTNATDSNWFYVFPDNPIREQGKLNGNIFLDFNNEHYLPSSFTISAEANEDPGQVPEPASIALLGLGLAGIAASRRRFAK